MTHERNFFSALERGNSLQNDLDRAVAQLHRQFPEVSFILEDRYGAPIRSVGNTDVDDKQVEWDSVQLILNQQHFGCIRYTGRLGYISNFEIAPIVLSLTELEHWALTESERRGEKVQKLLNDGLTPEVTRLLSLGGLNDSSGYVLMAMELTSRSDKYLYMDVLRKFMLGRIWGYQSSLDFVAFRPGGLLGIFRIDEADQWQLKVERWMDEWNNYQSSIRGSTTLGVRACIVDVDSLGQLEKGVRRVEATLQFADRWNLVGLIRPRDNYTISCLLSYLTERQILELVYHTLGPILMEEHTDLLHTLRVFLYLDQNVTDSARELYIHRNTLLYRIRHVEELLGVKLRNIGDLSAIWSALEGLELLERSGHHSVIATGSRI